MPGTSRSGRRRKPTALKVIEGTYRSDRHGAEPQVEVGWPDEPAWLSERERATWRELQSYASTWTARSDALSVLGVVRLVELLTRCREAQDATPEASSPLTYKVKPAEDGGTYLEPVDNPLVMQELKIWSALRSYITVMGLSPVDRAKMPANPAGAKKTESALQSLIRQHGVA